MTEKFSSLNRELEHLCVHCSSPNCLQPPPVHIPVSVCGSSSDKGVQALLTSAWGPASSEPQFQHGSDLQAPPPLIIDIYSVIFDENIGIYIYTCLKIFIIVFNFSSMRIEF